MDAPARFWYNPGMKGLLPGFFFSDGFQSAVEEVRALDNAINRVCKSKGVKWITKNKALRDKETLHTWKCAAGHLFEQSVPVFIKDPSYCPVCAGAEYSYKTLKKIAIKSEVTYKGKRSLSLNIQPNEILDFSCPKCRRLFHKSVREIKKKGLYCPHCAAKWKSEDRARRAVERILKCEMPQKSPEWLKSPTTGNRLIFDGYNEALRVAFEFQGPQHYRAVKRFGGEEALKQRKTYDAEKRALCKANGVTLIEIPYVYSNRLDPYIRSELKKALSDYEESDIYDDL